MTKNFFLKAGRTHPSQRAQGMVEFALALPILLMLVLGILETGRLLFSYISVVSASREAARFAVAVDTVSGVNQYGNCTEIKKAANRIGSWAGVTPASVTVYYDQGPGTALTQYCQSGPSANPNLTTGSRIKVQVRVSYSPAVPLPVFPVHEISYYSIRTLIKDAEVAPVW